MFSNQKIKNKNKNKAHLSAASVSLLFFGLKLLSRRQNGSFEKILNWSYVSENIRLNENNIYIARELIYRVEKFKINVYIN